MANGQNDSEAERKRKLEEFRFRQSAAGLRKQSEERQARKKSERFKKQVEQRRKAGERVSERIIEGPQGKQTRILTVGKDVLVEGMERGRIKSSDRFTTKKTVKDAGQISSRDIKSFEEQRRDKFVLRQSNIPEPQPKRVVKEKRVQGKVIIDQEPDLFSAGEIRADPRTFGQKLDQKLIDQPLFDVQTGRKLDAASLIKFQAANILDFGKGFVKSVVVDPLKFLIDFVGSPIETSLGVATGIKELTTNPAARRQLERDIETTFETRPGSFFGTIVGTASGPFLTAKGLDKASNLLKNVKVRAVSKVAGGTQIDDIIALSDDVLAGKSKFPLSKSTKDAVKRFNVLDDEGNIIVQTSSPSTIKGKVAGAGRKGAVGLEDPGIFVTPKGEGSPAFLRTSGADDGFSFSLNPLKGKFDQPTITEFKVSKVDLLPEEILKAPGFDDIAQFQKSQIGKGKAFITKRSQIGQGDISRQFFEVSDDFFVPQKNLRVNRDGKSILLSKGELAKKGDLILEAGTSELEAIIPKGSKFIQKPTTSFTEKLFGFKDFIDVDGTLVPIRRAEVLTDAKRLEKILSTTQKTQKLIPISPEKISRGSRAVSSIVAGGKSFVSPIDTLARLGSLLKSKDTKVSSSLFPKSQSPTFDSDIFNIVKASSSPVSESREDALISTLTLSPQPSGVSRRSSNPFRGISGVSSGLSSPFASIPISENELRRQIRLKQETKKAKRISTPVGIQTQARINPIRNFFFGNGSGSNNINRIVGINQGLNTGNPFGTNLNKNLNFGLSSKKVSRNLARFI